MDYRKLAEAALERRAKAVESLRALDSDKSLTDAEKRSKVTAYETEIQSLTDEARSYVEQGEQAAAIGDRAAGLWRESTQTRDSKAGRWLQYHLDPERRNITGAAGVGAAFTPVESANYFFDLLAPSSTLLASGVKVIRTQRDTLQIPRLLTDPLADFVAEATTLPSGDGTADTVTATPHKIGNVTAISNEVIADSVPQVLEAYTFQLIRSLSGRFDLGAYEGDPTANASSIRGLKNVSGITTTTLATNGLTPTNLDMIADALGTIESNNGVPGAIVMAPRTWQTLSKIKSVSGGAMPVLMESAGSASQGLVRSLYGIPVFLNGRLSTTETTGTANNTSSVYVYDPSQVYAVFRNDVVVMRDTSRLFNQDMSELRAIMRADVAVAQPKAVVRIAGLLP